MLTEKQRKNVFGYLSYSSGSEMASCPKRFQMGRLAQVIYRVTRDDKWNRRENSVAMSFGSGLGEGIQALLRGESLPKASLRAMAAWSMPLNAMEGKKSAATLLQAVQEFNAGIANVLGTWEVLRLREADGTHFLGSELGFQIQLPNSVFRMYLDLVLHNPVDDSVVLLELKTAGKPAEETYRYSLQGTIYQLILRVLAKRYGLNPINTAVNYQVFDTNEFTWHPMPFVKTRLEYQNALGWLMAKDAEIGTYISTDIWPQVGGRETCMSFFKRCPHYGQCHMDADNVYPLALIPEEFKYEDSQAMRAKNVLSVTLDELKEMAKL